MGQLALHLQRAFVEQCPPGWVCRSEVRLLSGETERLLGYSSRADVVLEQLDGSRRLWVEFEISRADPVANHAKFAVAHLFQPQIENDAFVTMVSAHVERGRRNLASGGIALMRRVGMNAFQTALLPFVPAAEIKRLNHLSLDLLAREAVPVTDEIERVFAVSQEVLTMGERRLHLVADVLDAVLNLRAWNREMAQPELRTLWRKRSVTYFVFDPFSGEFAPSKFCAYSLLPSPAPTATMSVEGYASLDGSDRRFDGQRAQQHLTGGLAMRARTPDESPHLVARFEGWLARHSDTISVHPSGPVFLLPPTWFG